MDPIEKNFFGEMDKKRKSVTPAWTILFVVLVLLFAVGIYGLVRVRNAYRKIDFAGWNIDTNLPKISLSNKILDQTKENNGNFSISLNSIELSAYLNLADDSFPLKNTYAKIKPDKVVIYGRLKSSRLGLPASITLRPEVQNNDIIFVNQPTEIENVYMPAETQQKISSAISNRVSMDLNLSGQTKVDKVIAEEDLLTFFIVPK